MLLAADYARRVGLYDRAINTAERTLTRHDYTMRYMTPWRIEFGAAARDQNIDEELLYAIARQESRFARAIGQHQIGKESQSDGWQALEQEKPPPASQAQPMHMRQNEAGDRRTQDAVHGKAGQK